MNVNITSSQKAPFTIITMECLVLFPCCPCHFLFSEPCQLIRLQPFFRMHRCEYNILPQKSQFTIIMMVCCLVLFLSSLLFTFSEPCQLICLQPFFRMHACEYIILPQKAQFTNDSCTSKDMNRNLFKYTSSVY